jgi:hypothetical protein
MATAHGIEELEAVYSMKCPRGAALITLAEATILLLVACRHEPPPAPPPTRIFDDEVLGLAFELPSDWTHERVGQRHLFSGPVGTTTYYTTVTLQSLGAGDKLDVALSRAYESALGYPAFAWERREPVTVASRPALCYSVTFELHEKQRRKTGLIIDSGRELLDISYGATNEIFPNGLPAFETMVSSLSFY